MPTTTRYNLNFLLPLAALSVLSLSAAAQSPAPSADGSSSYMQSQPAPIERSQATNQAGQQSDQAQPPQHYQGPDPDHYQIPDAQQRPNRPAIKTSQPAQGVYVRVTPQGSVTTVASTPGHTELRVDSGIANISIRHPEHDSMILVDLAGGQVALIKDGLYTFNADTKTARVLMGEAEAYPAVSAGPSGKGIKVKEDHAITFGGGELRAVEFEPFQARTDVLPRGSAAGFGDGAPAYPAYGYPYYGYPYYAWGYPYYGWGYPYGFGLGFGFYGGGFYGGGFRGGFGRR